MPSGNSMWQGVLNKRKVVHWVGEEKWKIVHTIIQFDAGSENTCLVLPNSIMPF